MFHLASFCYSASVPSVNQFLLRDVLRRGPNGPESRALATMGNSSPSRFSLNKILIRIISTVKCFFRLYSPENFGRYVNCDDRDLRIVLDLPPYAIITQLARWRQ
ncbi:hypothetical protein TNCV_2237111 [Trichonephila clavipes]|nr:hypothetical protein TNCV_2237111 [Trichonephila clavipes]